MIIAFDIGASKTRAALFRKSAQITKKIEYPTIFNYERAFKKLANTIENLAQGREVKFISGSMAAVCGKDGKRIIGSTRLKNFIGKPFAARLSAKFRSPVFFINDAACAGLGEAVLGAGQRARIVVYLTVSSGINGACVIDGAINPTDHNFQFGHQIIYPNGRRWDYCGQKGCLEAYASGIAFEKLYKMKPENCYESKIWNDFSFNLAIGLVNIIVAHSPEIIVVGGGVSKAGEKLFRPLKKHIKENLRIFKMPRIVKSKFGDDSGLVGGFILAKRFLKLKL